MNVYRVWFDTGNEKYGVCCVIVCAKDEERAIELAREEVKDFSELKNAQYSIMRFDTKHEGASIC